MNPPREEAYEGKYVLRTEKHELTPVEVTIYKVRNAWSRRRDFNNLVA